MVTCLFVVQCKGTLQRSLDIPPMSKNFLLEGHVTKTVIYYDKKNNDPEEIRTVSFRIVNVS